jgi:hypothetical protein
MDSNLNTYLEALRLLARSSELNATVEEMRNNADDVSEDDCIVCGNWPKANRSAMRQLIDSLPLQKMGQVCDQCVVTFWANHVAKPKRAKR